MSLPASPAIVAAPSEPAPIDADERLHSLDILRGLALAGMILVHFHQRLAKPVTGAEDLIGWFVWIFVEAKAWGTFAFLFGVGFAVLLRRLEARGEAIVPAVPAPPRGARAVRHHRAGGARLSRPVRVRLLGARTARGSALEHAHPARPRGAGRVRSTDRRRVDGALRVVERSAAGGAVTESLGRRERRDANRAPTARQSRRDGRCSSPRSRAIGATSCRARTSRCSSSGCSRFGTACSTSPGDTSG